MYLVSSGSKHSFKYYNISPRLWNGPLYAIAESKLNFLHRVDIFSPQATDYTEYGLKIALLLVGLEYLVVQM